MFPLSITGGIKRASARLITPIGMPAAGPWEDPLNTKTTTPIYYYNYYRGRLRPPIYLYQCSELIIAPPVEPQSLIKLLSAARRAILGFLSRLNGVLEPKGDNKRFISFLAS